jgi:hypothetical protein
MVKQMNAQLNRDVKAGRSREHELQRQLQESQARSREWERQARFKGSTRTHGNCAVCPFVQKQLKKAERMVADLMADGRTVSRKGKRKRETTSSDSSSGGGPGAHSVGSDTPPPPSLSPPVEDYDRLGRPIMPPASPRGQQFHRKDSKRSKKPAKASASSTSKPKPKAAPKPRARPRQGKFDKTNSSSSE